MSLLLPVQLILISFILFAASRAILKFKHGGLHFGALIFWISIWTSAILAIIYPGKTSQIAKMLGIGRGADVIIYASIAILFYLTFRLHAIVEDLRTEISRLIREIAIKNAKKK